MSTTDISQRWASADRLARLGELADEVVLATLELESNLRTNETVERLRRAQTWLDSMLAVMKDPLDLKHSLGEGDSLALLGQFGPVLVIPFGAKVETGESQSDDPAPHLPELLENLSSHLAALISGSQSAEDLRFTQSGFAALAQAALTLNADLLESRSARSWMQI